MTGIILTRNRVPSGSHPAAAALRAVATLGHPELTGATLTAGALSKEEGEELAALVKRRTGEAGLTDGERARYEALVGKSAGNDNLFAESRRERVAREKLGELTKEARMATLPRSPKYEEPGSVVIPAYVFEWLKTSREASWTVADTGMLVAVLGMFANRDATLINGARFEKDSDAENVLVVPEDVMFLPDANPHPLHGGPGQVKPAIALATIARNKWIEVKRADGGFRIRLGFRGKVDRYES